MASPIKVMGGAIRTGGDGGTVEGTGGGNCDGGGTVSVRRNSNRLRPEVIGAIGDARCSRRRSTAGTTADDVEGCTGRSVAAGDESGPSEVDVRTSQVASSAAVTPTTVLRCQFIVFVFSRGS